MSDKKVYVILGGSGGIGSALARKLAVHDVVIAAREETKLVQVGNETGAGYRVCDATQFDQVQAVVNFAVETYGRLDGIANCVGSILLKPAHLTSVDEFEEVLSQNLRSAFNTLKAGARAMMKEGGSIVFVSSAAARTGLMNHEAIAAAKAGIIGMTQSAAATYANRNIRVNCVAPGLVDTPMAARLTQNEASRKHSEQMHALGRLGQPEDVAEAMAWLMDGSRSGWVTGQVIGIDGGLGTVRPR